MSETWQSRTRSFENFRVTVFGDDFGMVMRWASEHQLRQRQYKCNQTYLSLVALTEDESQDFVTSAGNGARLQLNEIGPCSRRLGHDGEKLRITGDLKLSAFEAMLPKELGNHLVLSKKRAEHM